MHMKTILVDSVAVYSFLEKCLHSFGNVFKAFLRTVLQVR